MKTCSKCRVSQPLENFYKATGTRDGLRGECKGCFKARSAARHAAHPEPGRERARRWQQENPDRVRARREAERLSGKRREQDRRSYLKRKYGITPEQYDEMLAAQGGVCAICGRPPREDISLHVDHDHETGAIRGISCFRCNNALGDLNDDPKLLARAAQYLERHLDANDPEVQAAESRIRQRVEALTAR